MRYQYKLTVGNTIHVFFLKLIEGDTEFDDFENVAKLLWILFVFNY